MMESLPQARLNFRIRLIFRNLSNPTTMAAYNQYDARLESLVVETRTAWAAEVQDLTDEERTIIARAIHQHPELATQIHYERTHTGFTREITVTEADIARLYEQKVAGA
jgi:hypothetical protein